MRLSTLDLLRCPRSGQSLRLEAMERDGEGVDVGLLSSEAGQWPVVEGIAVLTQQGEAVVGLVRAGRVQEALAALAFDDAPRTRSAAVARHLDGAGVPRPVAAAAARLRARGRRQDLPLVAGGDPSAVLARALLLGRPAMPDAHAYFRYRFSLPRHLVALQVLRALPAGSGPLLDLGCGAGHMTFAATRLHPAVPVVGVDISFAQLWAARRLVAPSADLVCADVLGLPFRTGAFSGVVSVDVLSFVRDKWSAAREAMRVVAPGGRVAVTSVKDAAQSHVYAGMPLSAAGWAGLFEGAPVRVLDDDVLLDCYLAGHGVPVDDGGTGPLTRTASATVSLLVGAPLPAAPAVAEPPHAIGPLAVNPLYRAEPGPADGVLLRRVLPPGSYASDNARLLEYLPETAVLPHRVAAAGARGERPAALEPLVRSLVVLALPPGYADDPWPGADRGAEGRAVAW